MSVPKIMNDLTLAPKDFGSKYMQELGQVKLRGNPTASKVGPATYVEVQERLLRMQRMAVAHCGDNDTEN